MKVLVVVGTRPEAIKLAPVYRALRARPREFEVSLCSTGQHREMLDQVLATFGIEPDVRLRLMRENQRPATLAAEVLRSLEPVLDATRPDWVLVQGDTTTAMAAALGGFLGRYAIGHVEAGLRSFDRSAPFPEEVNRRIVSLVANVNFAPTEIARQNLLAENVDDGDIVVTGNTVIDAVLQLARSPTPEIAALAAVPDHARVIVLTAHRRENFGAKMAQICDAALDVVAAHSDMHVVFPVHLNPNLRKTVFARLRDADRVHLVEPMGYREFIGLMQRSWVVLTDSGGLQEEAPVFDKPVLVLRDVTERPEAVAAGTARLVGTERAAIVEAISTLAQSPHDYQRMARAVNPYGDGHAAARIVEALHQRGQRGRSR